MEHGEFARGGVAPQRHLIAGREKSRNLHLQIILIRPEPGYFAIGLGAPQETERCVLCLIDRVLHRLQAHARARKSRMVGAIAGRVDIGIGRTRRFVNDDAVIACETCSLRELDVGNDTDSHKHDIRRNASRACLDRLDARAAFEGFDAGAEHKLHAMSAMLAFVEFREDRAHRAHHDARGRLDDAHVETELPRDRADLKPDITAAYNGEARACTKILAQFVHVLDSAKVMDPGKYRARQIQLAHTRTRRDQKPVVGEHLASRDPHGLGGTVDRFGARGKPEIALRLRIEGFRLEKEPLAREIARKIGFGERRPLIKRGRVLAQHRDGAREAFGAQSRDRLNARLARADDDDAFHVPMLPRFQGRGG